MRRVALSGLCVLSAALALASPAAGAERDEPVVLGGEQLPALLGVNPERLVAFTYERTPNHRRERWTRIPVQVDQRRFVDFGEAPASNSTPGAEGTVYGGEPIGHGALQYADPRTWVGPDTDPALDGNDEVALMSGDAGDRKRKRARRPKPKDVRGKRSTRVEIVDPLGGPGGFVYLYEARERFAGASAADYVSYDFALTRGDYRSSYRRADGPNPERSRISTAVYEAGFSDRWYFDRLALRADAASGVDVLDGFKFGFGPTSCGRSEATFNDAEGAFVANIDGPVRAIRAYVGANSGPLTERTHIFYRDRHEIITDLRVHSVPGPLTYHDLSAAGLGMSYRNSESSAAVVIDGVPDQVSQTPPDWHLWAGARGSLYSADRLESSFGDPLFANASAWYLDDATPAPNLQCWGDSQALGQAGLRSTTGMPSTDPRTGGTDFLHSVTTDVLGGPAVGAPEAELIARRLDAPLGTAIRSLKP